MLALALPGCQDKSRTSKNHAETGAIIVRVVSASAGVKLRPPATVTLDPGRKSQKWEATPAAATDPRQYQIAEPPRHPPVLHFEGLRFGDYKVGIKGEFLSQATPVQLTDRKVVIDLRLLAISPFVDAAVHERESNEPSSPQPRMIVDLSKPSEIEIRWRARDLIQSVTRLKRDAASLKNQAAKEWSQHGLYKLPHDHKRDEAVILIGERAKLDDVAAMATAVHEISRSVKGVSGEEQVPVFLIRVSRAAESVRKKSGIDAMKLPSPKGKAPKWSLGLLERSGEIDGKALQKATEGLADRFARCTAKGLSKDPALEGDVRVRYQIGVDGVAVHQLSAGSDIENRDTEECLVDSLQWLEPPTPDVGPVTVIQTITVGR